VKKLVSAFTASGFVSGFLFAMGPFLFGTPTRSLASYIAPVILGLLVVATHRLNWRWLHGSGRRSSRWLLFRFNLALLVFFLLGFVALIRLDADFPHRHLAQIGFLALWPLPLAVSAIFLCIPQSMVNAA
jgi:hypothetical protein